MVRRILRHPSPLSGYDTATPALVVREAGFGIAGPKAPEVPLIGTVIDVAAIGGLTVPE